MVAQGARLLEHLAAHRARQPSEEKTRVVVDPDPQVFFAVLRIRDPGSGAFFYPGYGIGFSGSRISDPPDPKPIFLIA